MSKPTVGYWNFRGLAQPIRALLAYQGVEFTDKRYSTENEGAEWFTVKPTLGLDFPNIPYLIDGDVKLTQTLAILRYLGRKYGLEGATEAEKNRVALLEQQVNDLAQSLFRTLFSPQYESVKGDYVKGLPDSLKGLSVFLGANQWSAGGAGPSYVDFWLYEYLVKIAVFAPEAFGQFESLKQFIKRVEGLPKLAAWLKKTGPSLFVAKGPFQAKY